MERKDITDILSDWAIIEADFQREYGLNLVEALPQMSWRRFIVLLNALSGNSVYLNVLRGRKEGLIPVEDPEVGERVMESFFKF